MELSKIQKSIEILTKQEKIYLKPGQQPPKGVQTFRGPRGGYYYIGEAGSNAMEEQSEEELPFEVDAVEHLKTAIDDFKNHILPIFKELPEWHYKNASFLMQGADELSEDAGGKKLYHVGLYNHISRVIYISEIVGELTENDVENLYEGKISVPPKRVWKLVALHEMAHRLMDFQKVSLKHAEMVKEENGGKISDKPSGGCTQYALKNQKERFAEAYVFYIENPSHLMQTDKNMYNFMKDVVFEGKEYAEPLVKSIGGENLPPGSYWMESEKYAKMLRDRKMRENISKEINDFLDKAYTPGGSYIPVTTLVHRKDGGVSTAIRWKRYEELGVANIRSRKDLPALRTPSQTPGFTRGSSIKQTMFLLVDESDIGEILQSNFVPTINYEFLGEGLYLYNNIEIAKERAGEAGKKVLPVKADVTKIFSTKLDDIRNQNIENLSTQGYEAIVLMRNSAYEFDLFCFDNRDVVAIGEEISETQDFGEIRKAIEGYELQDANELVSKEWLEKMRCIPYTDAAQGIAKAGRPQPAPLKEDGSVDYDSVGIGDSIWVTVTQEGSPLEGRPVIITKRPDGLFALTGGSGFSRMKEQHGIKTRTDALRHLVMTGKPKKTKADEELDRLQEEEARKNEPFIQKKQELMAENRKQLDEFQRSLDDALHITATDKLSIKKHRDEFIENAKRIGLDDETAGAYATSIIRSLTPVNRMLEERQRLKAGIAIKKYKEMLQRGEITPEQAVQGFNKDVEFQRITVDINPKQFEGKTAKEIQSAVDNIIDEKYGEIINPNPEDKNIAKELKAQGVELNPAEKDPNIQQIELGSNIKPLAIKDEHSLLETGERFTKYHQTKKEINMVSKKIRKMNAAKATPAMIEEMKMQVKQVLGENHSDAEIEDVLKSYDEQYKYNNSAISFYKAVGEFWNDEKSLRERLDRTDNGFGGYINGGAASALAALSGANYGERTDVSKLIEKTSIETAGMLMAMDLRERLKDNPAQYDEIIRKVEESNSKLLIDTEQRALQRHATLKKRYENIQEAKKTGLLQPREAAEGYRAQTGMVEGEVYNLIEQKKNLGSALGSMQASASFLNALITARDAKDDSISLNFGEDSKGAELRANELGIEGRRGMIDASDPRNITLMTSASALRRYMRSIEVTKDIHDENERIKTDMSGTSMDEDGNLVVDNYNIPTWNEQYKPRVEQRNDIEFLKKMGNGVITRVTGAGKTNTSLGYFANKIAEDKNYSAVAVVPKGRGEQWVEEAKKFFGINVVQIPEKISKEERAKLIASIKPGQVAVISQQDAVVSYYDLEAAFADGGVKGLVLDEPQEIASKSISGNMSSATRKLMKLQAENRIALTATPARDNLIESYDLVNWASHHDKKLGPRTRFQAVYGGYGSGTNAQDTTLQQMIFREISPYISGDRLTNPTFKVSHNDVIVRKTKRQDANMRKIEADANKYIVEAKNKAIQDVINDPVKLKRAKQESGKQWKSIVASRAAEKARKEILDLHDNNLSGISNNMTWKDNPKIDAAVQRIAAGKDKKHVIFLDNPKQRAALKEGLLSIGFNPKQIKNIASTIGEVTGPQMSANARAFRTDKNVRIIFIDKKSASGYNLQEGDDLHVLGTPSDAAVYLQAQGRLARMPRTGDVSVHTYKYSDVPFEDMRWTKLENQLAILKATAPGLFSRGKNA